MQVTTQQAHHDLRCLDMYVLFYSYPAPHMCKQGLAIGFCPSVIVGVVVCHKKKRITGNLEAITIAKQKITMKIPQKSICAYLIVTKMILVSVSFSHLTAVRSAIFNTVKKSNMTEAGHTRSLDMYSNRSIRREVSVPLLWRSVTPTACIRHYTSTSLHAVLKMVQSAESSMSVLETSTM